MARTKAKARRGREGHAFQEAVGHGEIGSLKQNNRKKIQGKRQRETAHTVENDPVDSLLPLAKKPKKNDSSTFTASDLSRSIPNNRTPPNCSTVPAVPGDLQSKHEVTPVSIISSSRIQKKVTRILELLAGSPTTPPAKPSVVMLYSKAACASKAVSVAEIARRELAQGGGKWFQYIQVESPLEVQDETKPKNKSVGGHKNTKDVDELGSGNEDEEMDETFETMKTPFERAIEGQPKVRAVPTMAIYISRASIEILKKSFGEQSNA